MGTARSSKRRSFGLVMAAALGAMMVLAGCTGGGHSSPPTGATPTASGAFKPPAAGVLFTMSQESIRRSQQLLHNGDSTTDELVNQLKDAAESALSHPNPTVISKKQTPPSGNKHDYYSVPPYYWPVPGNPSAPYTDAGHDGHNVPDFSDFTDLTNLKALEQDTSTLALAFALTGDKRYADKATAMINTWFLDPATNMNPNLNYAQVIRNDPSRLPVGIIDTNNMPEVLDAIVLLHDGGVISETAYMSLTTWFQEYLKWLTTSQQAGREAAFGNNRTTWYWAQVAAVAAFVGDKQTAQTAAAHGKDVIDEQIDSDGKLPAEISRTKSWDYTTYDLEALVRLALAGANTGVDLFGYTGKKGGTLRGALNFMAAHRSNWPYPNTSTLDLRRMQPSALIGARVYGDTALVQANQAQAAPAAAQLAFMH